MKYAEPAYKDAFNMSPISLIATAITEYATVLLFSDGAFTVSINDDGALFVLLRNA